MEISRIEYRREGQDIIGTAYDTYNRFITSKRATCHPEDKFNFAYGVALCNTRLIQEIERMRLAEEAAPPYYFLKKNFVNFSFDKPYKMYTAPCGDNYFINDCGKRIYSAASDDAYLNEYFYKPETPKDYLHNGMCGKCKNGVYFVVVNNLLIYGNGEFDEISELSDDLEDLWVDKDDPDYCVIDDYSVFEIYAKPYGGFDDELGNRWDNKNLELVWRRLET